MASDGKKAVGRPTTRAKDGPGDYVGFRASKSLKGQLEAAARNSSRSLSAEAQMRLEQSFRDQDLVARILELAYGDRLAGILMILAEGMDRVGRDAAFQATGTLEGVRNWTSHPWVFTQATEAAARVLDALRPDGAVIVPNQWTFEGSPDLGEQLGSLPQMPAASIIPRVLTDFLAPDENSDIPSDRTRFVRELLGPIADAALERLTDEAGHTRTGDDK